jgi:hypothetical protein
MGAVLRAYMEELALARFLLGASSKLASSSPLARCICPAPSQPTTLHPMRTPNDGSSHWDLWSAVGRRMAMGSTGGEA